MYIDNLKPLCSSLEQSSNTAILPPPMRITADGYSAWLTSQNDLGIHRYMAVLGKGHYLVMVDPASLVDVVPFGEISMDAALVGSETHRIFARSNIVDPYILSVVKEQQDVTRVQYNGSMYVLKPVPELGFTVIAWASLKPLAEYVAPAADHLATGWHLAKPGWCPYCPAHPPPFAVTA